MLVQILPIFVVDTKITFVYNFVAPLNFSAWEPTDQGYFNVSYLSSHRDNYQRQKTGNNVDSVNNTNIR